MPYVQLMNGHPTQSSFKTCYNYLKHISQLRHSFKEIWVSFSKERDSLTVWQGQTPYLLVHSIREHNRENSPWQQRASLVIFNLILSSAQSVNEFIVWLPSLKTVHFFTLSYLYRIWFISQSYTMFEHCGGLSYVDWTGTARNSFPACF